MNSPPSWLASSGSTNPMAVTEGCGATVQTGSCYEGFAVCGSRSTRSRSSSGSAATAQRNTGAQSPRGCCPGAASTTTRRARSCCAGLRHGDGLTTVTVSPRSSVISPRVLPTRRPAVGAHRPAVGAHRRSSLEPIDRVSTGRDGSSQNVGSGPWQACSAVRSSFEPMTEMGRQISEAVRSTDDADAGWIDHGR